MKTSKPPVKYQGISIPLPLINEIKTYIKNNPEYRSIGEFTREAIRDKLNESALGKQSLLYDFNKGLKEINKRSKEFSEILDSFDEKSMKKLRELSRIISNK